MAIRIYTRTGDTGETALFGGGRVAKHHIRVSAYGDVDELNSCLGLARATPPTELFDELLAQIQRDLFAIGGQLATPEPARVQRALEKAVVPPERIGEFEAAIDHADLELPPLKAFILPGGGNKAATLHVARAVCRRAERSAVELASTAPVEPLFLTYLNRLSDLLFTMARVANHQAGIGDTTW